VIDDPPSLHRYFYANDNPTRYVDPDGHESLAEVVARERERREAIKQPAPSFTTDMGGGIVRADGPAREPNRQKPATTLDELTPEQRGMLSREIARVREEQEWRDRHPTVIQEDGKEGLLEKIDKLEDKAVAWAGDHAEAITKKGLAPSKDRPAGHGEALRVATEGTAAEYGAKPVADRDIAQQFQETGGEISRAGVEGGTRLAIQYAETEVGLKGVNLGIGAVAGGLRKVPNPWGRLGSPAHRAEVDEVVAQIRARGLRAETEVGIPTVGGAKQTRYMDVVARDPATGRIVEVHQVGRVLKSDPLVPVARERAALRDVRRSPELRDAKRIFHEY
jgi:hypothetical protein